MSSQPWITDGKPQQSSTSPDVTGLYKSNGVFINGVNVVLYDTPGDSSAGAPSIPAAEAAVESQDDAMVEATPAQVAAQTQALVASGAITQEEADRGLAAANDPTATVDNTPSTYSGKGKNVDCSKFHSMSSFSAGVVLTPNGTTIGKMMVQSPHTIAAQHGLTADQIVCNLANLASNIYEPLKAQYPNCIVGNSFRPGGGLNASGKISQHEYGMAGDFKFRGMSKGDYIKVAQWVKNNLPFDQLIMENSPKGDLWVHVSYYSGGLGPHKNGAIGNMVDGLHYQPGLRDLSTISYVRQVPTA